MFCVRAGAEGRSGATTSSNVCVGREAGSGAENEVGPDDVRDEGVAEDEEPGVANKGAGWRPFCKKSALTMTLATSAPPARISNDLPGL